MASEERERRLLALLRRIEEALEVRRVFGAWAVPATEWEEIHAAILDELARE